MTPFDYEKPFSGNAEFAISTILGTLLPLDFKIIEQSTASLIVEAPKFTSTHQNVLLGMSRGEFIFSHATISLHAELGGVEHITRLLLILLMGMGAINAAVFTGLWFFVEKLHSQAWFLAIPALVFLPWIFIAPIMTKWIRKRCEEALMQLLDDLAFPQAPGQF